jgi:hypothetical protein
MTNSPDSKPWLERWPALLVRYWAFNMCLIHDRGSNWLGFGYRVEEKATLKSIAAKVSGVEYGVWLGLTTVLFVIIGVAIVLVGMSRLMHAIGGEQHMSTTPAPLFFLQLAIDLVASLAIGFPAAMLPAAALAGRWFRVTDVQLPDRATTSYYFHKLWFQITRIAILGGLALLPIWMFVPTDSKFWVTAQLVLPLFSPAVAALTAAYYTSARLRRSV